MWKKVPDTNGGSLRIRLANPYQRILYFSLKTMFCILKSHGVLLKQPPLVPDIFNSPTFNSPRNKLCGNLIIYRSV